jgi:SAM-dependent methyltransferase
MTSWLEANRANWNDRVAIHVDSDFYGVESWLASGRGPNAEEIALLGDVTGASLVHLQCHFGMDTLSWARAGANVTGVDFSEAAIAAVTDLAARAGLSQRAHFVLSDVAGAPAALARRFDVVYVSLGSLCWLPRIEDWADVVAALLDSRGTLLVHDVHPLAFSLDDDGTTFAYPYFEERDAIVIDDASTYTDGGAPAHSTTYEWNHSLGEIVTALAKRSVMVTYLAENPWTSYRAHDDLIEDPRGIFRAPEGSPQLPLSFTLRARWA